MEQIMLDKKTDYKFDDLIEEVATHSNIKWAEKAIETSRLNNQELSMIEDFFEGRGCSYNEFNKLERKCDVSGSNFYRFIAAVGIILAEKSN